MWKQLALAMARLVERQPDSSKTEGVSGGSCLTVLVSKTSSGLSVTNTTIWLSGVFVMEANAMRHVGSPSKS